MRVCAWLVMAFDSAEQDPRDYLKFEYGGLTLHIKPGHGDNVSLISVFLEDKTKYAEAQLVINRFLSAMAWKDGRAFVTLGGIAGGARPTEKDNPRFNYSEDRVLRGTVISQFDFEHLQNPPDDKQKLALALYREGQNSHIAQFYRFLSFFKILNIKLSTGKKQVEWINTNLGKIWNFKAQTRLAELQKTEPNIGEYLWKQRRNAIAHANIDPILDPDMPADRTAAKQDADLMEGLAEVLIQEELRVPSLRKIWQEHLYELEGFKRLFGEVLTARLKAKENVPLKDFPPIPHLTLDLKGQPQYDSFTALPFQIVACKDGVLLISTDYALQPMAVALVLDFPSETLQLALNMFGVNQKHEKYTKAIAVSYFNFLISYFCNGCLEVFNAHTRERLSHKTAFIPVNIDLHATVEGWKKKIEELGSE
jgi:Methylamine utilization protein MauJ